MLEPILFALVAGLCTWGLTGVGAASVFFFREFNRRTLDGTLGFAAGVMIAASFWSLLAPSIEMSSLQMGNAWKWLPPLCGFLLGGLFLWSVDKILPHLHLGNKNEDAEGLPTQWQRSILLVLAITLHNIPEGLAVGVAFGAVGNESTPVSLMAAISLAVGIGIQNIPEGAAISIPLRREGLSRFQCFTYGQLSGLVEPIAAVVGAMIVSFIVPVLPYALAFAAGAMIYVVVEELIPTSREERHSDAGTIGAMLGFAVMMTLDVALG